MTTELNLPVVLIEVLRLKAGIQEYTPVAQAMAARIEREGISTLTFVQQYARAGSEEITAVLVFADARDMMKHVEMVETWSEFHALVAMIEVISARVLGTLPEEAKRWLRKFASQSEHFDVHVAGFSQGSSNHSLPDRPVWT
jgi:hypothetical protein